MNDRRHRGIYRNLTRYGDPAFSRYLRRAFLMSAGYDGNDLDRPVIGVVDTRSDYNTCHRQMPEMVEAVKRGILEAGGLPMVFPTISLNEILTAPTTMLYRNLMAMDTEEMIRAQPMDAVVLMGGCDKTVPAQIMAALSADLPAISVVAGPMLAGRWRDQRLGACTDCRRLWADYRAGEISEDDIREVERRLCATGGTCMVMGTASTMACLTETLGLMLPGGATAPHATGERLAHCTAAGRRAVSLAVADVRPSDIVTGSAIRNAVTVLVALGGSTNAVIHLLAIARRAGIPLSLDDFHQRAQEVPVLVDVKPAGAGYMEDFHHAGGVPALLRQLAAFLELEAMTVTGESIGDLLNRETDSWIGTDVIRDRSAPVTDRPALTVLAGSLAPDGAVLKTAAADPRLFRHRGPAVVFDSPEAAIERIDDPRLNLTPEHVLVLRNTGPIACGMPEAGSLPIPKYLAAQGVRDMVRISDGRMSGTGYGTVILHAAPEAAAGGPIDLVADGDPICLDVEAGRIDLEVSESELTQRKARRPERPLPARGWKRLYAAHVMQADRGADLDFL